MSNNEWVREGTPRDDAEWTEDADEYGVPVEPAEWDDYSDEQAMPVPPRPVQPDAEQLTPADAPFAEPVLPVDDAGEHTSLPTAPDLDEVGTDAGVEDEPSVFDDQQRVDAADDDLTREVSEGIAAEQASEHEGIDAEQASQQDHDGHGEPDDEYLPDDELADHRTAEPEDVETRVHDAVAVGDHDDEDGSYTAAEELIPAEEGFVEPEQDAVARDEHLEGGATRVDPDALEETSLVEQYDDTQLHEETEGELPLDSDPVVPVAAAGTGAAGAALAAGLVGPSAGTSSGHAAMAGLYRSQDDETQVMDTAVERRSIEDEAHEEEARAAALRADKAERDRRLGMVQTSTANAERDVRTLRRGVGGFGSFGLFVLRLITAGILGIVAYQVLYSIDATADFLSGQPLIPEPRLVAWIVGFTLAAMAVMLVIGLGVRVVGVLLAAIAIAALILIHWGNFSPFVDGMDGFLGDRDLLLAGVGLLFMSLGGGRFGIDGAISRSRADAREAKRP